PMSPALVIKRKKKTKKKKKEKARKQGLEKRKVNLLEDLASIPPAASATPCLHYSKYFTPVRRMGSPIFFLVLSLTRDFLLLK
ncbi:MAG: hypothetical protein ACTSRA_14395, partial [Promethearchaeota archaeon]